jgi:surfeit locus 1 family protein
MKRIPVFATIVVLLAVAAMIALGLWQLDRRAQKEALLASYARNAVLPVLAMPRPPMREADLFRRASAYCLRPTNIVRAAGRSADGVSGWRHIADCQSGIEGPGFKVEMGVSQAADFTPQWRGGEVSGVLTFAPSATPMIQRLFGRSAPPTPMLVADRPLAPGLERSRAPDPSGIPNNHLAYAVQWFAFAVIALVIYALALRRRRPIESFRRGAD